jgi:predicted dehydrogenase
MNTQPLPSTSQADAPAATTRRGFLKTTGVAAASGVFAAQLSFPQGVFAAGSAGDTLRVGLVGCGGRGTGAASQALNADKNAILTAVADVFPAPVKSSLAALKGEQGVADRVQVPPEKQFVGLDAFQRVIDSGVEVVLLCTPPGFRPQHLKAAVAAGKHVFCEKPMATDAPGVRSVLEAVEEARKKKLSLVAGFCWRYDDACREFYKRIHDGALGEVRAVHATYLTGPVKPMPAPSERPSGMGDMEWQLRNWYNFTWLSGDGLVEQACHSVDKIAWAMNGRLPMKAVGNGGRMVPNHEGNIFDHIDVYYEYEDGARATMAQRQIANCFSDNSDYVLGSKGTGKGGWNPPTIRAGETWRYRGPNPGSRMYQTEHNELFASIRKGEPMNDGIWMAHSTLMAIMGRMAAYTGQEITWEMALNSQEKLVPDNPTWDMKHKVPSMAQPGTTKYV